ncbi:MAG: ABC transporter permease [Victivallales bacterium]|nr:ABC transporter permease [Victivallales bacterium]
MNRFAKHLLPFSSLIFIFSLWTFLVPDTFLSVNNLSNVLTRSTANGIMAAGMTFVIITSGIDLSVGSLLAMSGMLGSIVMLLLGGGTWSGICSGTYVDMALAPMLVGTLAAIVIGGLCGLFNGLCITRLKLAPFIVTLGSMSIFRGVSYVLNDGKPFAISKYTWLDTGTVLGIPSSIWIFAIVLLGCGFMLKRTSFGRYVYAIGSNPSTAFHSGINVQRILVYVYMLMGALTGLAAMIYSSRSSSAQPSAGLSMELDVVAAVIIGGCPPSGGRGNMTGTLIGTLLISFLRNGLTLLGVSTNLQLIVIGFIIIFAVTADQIAARKG